MQKTPVLFLGWEFPLEKGWVPTLVFMGFFCGSDGKESSSTSGDLGLVPWLGRSPGGGHGNPPLAWRIPMDRGAWWATVQ